MARAAPRRGWRAAQVADRPDPPSLAVGRRLGAAAVVLFVLAGLVACSPEATRTRGDGPGADVGNRGATVEIHGRTNPANGTPSVGRAVRT